MGQSWGQAPEAEPSEPVPVTASWACTAVVSSMPSTQSIDLRFITFPPYLFLEALAGAGGAVGILILLDDEALGRGVG